MEIKMLEDCRDLSGEYEKDETYEVEDEIGQKFVDFGYAVKTKKSTRGSKVTEDA